MSDCLCCTKTDATILASRTLQCHRFLGSHPVDNADKAKEYHNLLDQYWPSKPGKKNVPTDWFGSDLYQKARSAGPEFELRYRDEYGLTCLFVHSGFVMIDDISNEALINAFALGHLNFRKSYLQATAIVCQSLHLLKAKPGLQNKLRDLEDIHEKILAQILAAKDGLVLPGG